MSSSTLRDFASAAVQSKRIRFGDLRRLKRDILPARITTREEAEVLIALARTNVRDSHRRHCGPGRPPAGG